jgi:hypothetical protein
MKFFCPRFEKYQSARTNFSQDKRGSRDDKFGEKLGAVMQSKTARRGVMKSEGWPKVK